ncbi:uracil phosphoribosyltransferase [Bifidobacterium gallicum DSM 20093 = LMG 11596]|uniref:Uracil phosphoribosyltransferase n=2 Tax=Bifidobacterium gallicum TaxID=78342 RepID=D1NVY4_9BIFI|nr:uracil phosphoribosyltransferase [Bifidobacterium gallicum DSM 20093 = LMG 11596]KFI60001.1 uracil phosphoribosyltransferase [Bifidobacterium gallicum DSM 20093 = LMG 11596]
MAAGYPMMGRVTMRRNTLRCVNGVCSEELAKCWQRAALCLETMELQVLDHPLVEHKLTILRDKNTSSSTFRELVTELVTLEAYEATRNIAVVDKPIETPVAPMIGKAIAKPRPIIVPVLRAGLGMLDGMTRMLPSAEVGFLGMKRDEENPTQQITYANRLPDDLTGRQCFLIDPMLATGGTLVAATHYLADRGAKDVTAVCIIAAPEGIKYVEENIDPSIDFKVVVCGVDEGLNDKSYIVPGLGDAGDRLYGVID